MNFEVKWLHFEFLYPRGYEYALEQGIGKALHLCRAGSHAIEQTTGRYLLQSNPNLQSS